MNQENIILLLQKGFTVTEIARFYGVSVESVLKCVPNAEQQSAEEIVEYA